MGVAVITSTSGSAVLASSSVSSSASAVASPKAVLLVDDNESEVFEFDAILNQGVVPMISCALPSAMWRRMSRLRSCSSEPVSSTMR